MSEILSYEALVAEFEESLLTRLRGHRSTAPFLEMWVPDEDPVRSLLSLFEAAELAGETEVVLRLAKSTLAGRDLADVEAVGAEFGAMTCAVEADGWLIRLTLASGRDPLLAVPEAFRVRLGERLGQLRFAKASLSGDDDTVKLALAVPRAAVLLEIAPDRRIVSASHSDVEDPVAAATLDYFCEVLIGLPLEEAAHHGCHRLLARLQAQAPQPAVPGIVLPQNAGDMFAAPLALCQAMRPAWLALGHPWPEENFFADAPSAKWLGLSDAARRDQVGEVLAEDGAASLVSLDPNLLGQPMRVVIALSEKLSTDEKPARVRKLERLLASRLESRLEVYVEELKDQSGIRRL